MFRKITSNQVDKPTLWQEIYKRWEDQINILSIKITAILINYPRAIYSVMITSILISLVCFFYLPKIPQQNTPITSASMINSVSSSIGSIASTAGAAKEILELQSILENIVNKDSLTQQDSMMVLYVFERMQQIENSIIKPTLHDSLTHK